MNEPILSAILDWPDLIAFITVLSVLTTVFYKIYTAKSGTAFPGKQPPEASNGIRSMEKDLVRVQADYRSIQKDIGRVENQLVEMRGIMDTQGKAIATIHGILKRTLQDE